MSDGGQQQEPSGKPGRYQRSTGALFGAMIVTVVAVLAFVGLRALVSNDLEVEPSNIDYAEMAEGARSSGYDVVAPSELPSDWIATSVDLDQTSPASWSLGMLTDTSKFIGIQQATTSASEMVKAYIDEDAEQGADATVESVLGDTWQTWTDEGGDTGYLIEHGEERVLVYGSAPAEDLLQLIGLLEVTPRS